MTDLLQRLHLLRCQGVEVPADWWRLAPLEPAALQARWQPAAPDRGRERITA